MRFFKMNSIGNDFVAVHFPDVFSENNLSRLALKLCDRKYGVGADQAIFFSYKAQQADVRFFNQDGTEAEMCGNGIRAIGLLLKQLYAITSVSARAISSVVEIKINKDDLIETRTEILPLKYSTEYTEEIMRYIKNKLPNTICINLVNVGNPHVDIYVPEKGYIHDAIVKIGADIDRFVTGGVNVGFIGIKDNEVYLKVWERGSGFTLGCGSGACAAAFTVSKLKLVPQNDIVIHQIGGDLRIAIEDQLAITYGRAEVVFEGVMYERGR